MLKTGLFEVVSFLNAGALKNENRIVAAGRTEKFESHKVAFCMNLMGSPAIATMMDGH